MSILVAYKAEIDLLGRVQIYSFNFGHGFMAGWADIG